VKPLGDDLNSSAYGNGAEAAERAAEAGADAEAKRMFKAAAQRQLAHIAQRDSNSQESD
jgi:hypothetical protein